MNDTELLLLSKKDLYQYFSMQWKSHSEDQRLGHWTNMRLVGVEADGAFSSVQVSQILVLRYILYILCFLPPGPPSRDPPSVREPL